MSKLGFDGRVAVITGAGRGIGRAYALLLAKLGANVVVNDLGASTAGDGSDAGPAADVVADIVAAGGVAVADENDVSDVDGAETLIRKAIASFGQLDIVINNAGIIRWAAFPELDAENLSQHLAVHVGGSFNTVRAAWPQMVEQGYGRIVMTTSSGMLGLPNNTSYAAAKGAVVGMTRSLALAGRKRGIKINAIAPAAATRMGMPPSAEVAAAMAPEFVAPMAAFLAHEDCPVSGEIYTAGAGRFARLFIGSTVGLVSTGTAPTIEDVAAGWAAINDETDYFVPAGLLDWSSAFTSHLDGS